MDVWDVFNAKQQKACAQWGQVTSATELSHKWRLQVQIAASMFCWWGKPTAHHLQTESIDAASSTMEWYLNTIETFRPKEKPANAQDGGGLPFTKLHIQTKGVHTYQLARKGINPSFDKGAKAVRKILQPVAVGHQLFQRAQTAKIFRKNPGHQVWDEHVQSYGISLII